MARRRRSRIVVWCFAALSVGLCGFLISFTQRSKAVLRCVIPGLEDDAPFCHGLEDFNAPMIKPLPTFLWGIPTLERDVKRRETIRSTYLTAFQSSINPHRICPLHNFTAGCQVAYIFFTGANPNGPTELLDPNSSFPITISPPKGEGDVVYLNIKENQMDGKMTTFFRYASEFRQFDYIAKVDDDTLLFPQNLLDYLYDELPSKPYRVHGGLAMNASSCDPNIQEDHACPLPLVGDVYMSGEFTFMSRDLAAYISNTTLLPEARRRSITLKSHEDISLSNYVFSVDEPVEVIDISKNRILRSERFFATWTWATQPFRHTVWAHSTRSSGGYYKSLENFRHTWKSFVRSAESNFAKLPAPPRIVCQSNDTFNSLASTDIESRPTFLWGIRSMLDDKERRQAIRDTYLGYFHRSDEPHRVCALSKYTPECQVAYTFFVGANPEGRNELLDPNASLPITVDNPRIPAEDDVVFLNIKDNQTGGKVTTWLKYASQSTQFDYIATVQDDTFVFLSNFLDFAQTNLTKAPTRVFGGITFDKHTCDRKASRKDHQTCPLPLVGEVYMGGELTFMSRDLALHITDASLLPSYRRRNVTIDAREDISISNYVFSTDEPVEVIDIPKNQVLRKWKLSLQDTWLEDPFSDTLWAHSPIKSGGFFSSVSRFRRTWREYLVYMCSKKHRPPHNKFELFDSPIPSTGNEDALEIDDFIYTKPYSPVVIENHKLVFFTVLGAGDSTWKQLFRRMMGFSDWETHPSKLEDDGLRYLSDYSLDDARKIMKDYTLAMMVRDPKERFLDAFLKYKGPYFVERCCPTEPRSARNRCELRSTMFSAWAADIHTCDRPEWRPQGQWIDPKYYRQLDYVLHFETAQQDAETLLTQIGAWEKYGKAGWSKGTDDSVIFNKRSSEMLQAKETRKLMVKGFRQEVEPSVENFYRSDYQSFFLNIRNRSLRSIYAALEARKL